MSYSSAILKVLSFLYLFDMIYYLHDLAITYISISQTLVYMRCTCKVY